MISRCMALILHPLTLPSPPGGERTALSPSPPRGGGGGGGATNSVAGQQRKSAWRGGVPVRTGLEEPLAISADVAMHIVTGSRVRREGPAHVRAEHLRQLVQAVIEKPLAELLVQLLGALAQSSQGDVDFRVVGVGFFRLRFRGF